MNISTVCFTGHRPSDLGTTPAIAKSALRKAIAEAIKRGATTFIAGGAIGVDTYASQLVIEAKASNPSIKLYIAVPFRGFTKYWSNAQRIEYADIIRKCDGFKVICDKPSKHAYHVRNSFMVDRADLVIAYWSGKRSGGTYATVQYAQQTHTPVVNCYPKEEPKGSSRKENIMNKKPAIVGITERGDAGLDLSWVDKIENTDYSVIITKNPTLPAFQKAVLEHKHKIILHVTITGHGSEPMEPNVPHPWDVVKAVDKLTTAGFPTNQIVWRIDPIVPIEYDMADIFNDNTKHHIVDGLLNARFAFDAIQDSRTACDCKRIRVSVFDAYAHARKRILEKGIYKIPYEGFTAPKETFDKINAMLNEWKAKGYTIEACAEPQLNVEHIGCVNQKDASLFGITLPTTTNNQNRKGCLCSTAKVELLNCKAQCPHKCAYCYWKTASK